jgi:putative hydrolase of the HAD superfamily
VVGHLSFDVWLTLLRSNQTFKSLRNHLIIEMFEIPQPVTAVDEVFRRMDRIFTKVNEIAGKNLDSQEMLLLILAQLDVPLANVSKAQLQDFEQQAALLFWEHPPQLIDHGLPEILSNIVAKGVTISTLSNTGFISGAMLRQYFEQQKLGTYFAFQCYSDEHDCSKPSSIFYEVAYRNVLKIKDIEKENILHIGDNPVADVKGATDFGFSAALSQPEAGNIKKIVQTHGVF